MSSSTNKETYLKVTFEYGYGYLLTSSFAYYTNRNTQVPGFTNATPLEVETPLQTGGLKEGPCAIKLPIDAFTDRLSDIYPHAQCKVTVVEVEEDDAGSVSFVIYVGEVSKTVRNPEGKTNLVKIEAVTDKDILDVSLGLPADNHCVWTFGHFLTCKKDLNPLTQTGITVDVITGKDVELSGYTIPIWAPLPPDKYFHRGYLEYQGLRLLIRDWDPLVPDVFHLVTEPPPSWLTASIVLVPGCDKTPGTCDLRWGQISEFNGFGSGIPPYQPVFEMA